MPDSLTYNMTDLLSVPETGYAAVRDTVAAAIYGPHSEVVAAGRFIHNAGALTSNPLFQCVVLALSAAFVVLIFRNLVDILSLAGRFSRSSVAGKRITEESGGGGFSRFLNIVTAMGLLFVGVAAVKVGDTLLPRTLHEALPRAAALLIFAGGAVAASAVALYQWWMMRVVGLVTISGDFMERMLMIKRVYFSFGVLMASPVILLFVLMPAGRGGGWLFLLVVVVAAVLLLYLRESLHLFISKKVSILHWFLYLCTVDLFPLSLVWFVGARVAA